MIKRWFNRRFPYHRLCGHRWCLRPVTYQYRCHCIRVIREEDAVNGPCPTCGLRAGFHDRVRHSEHQVPRDKIVSPGWQTAAESRATPQGMAQARRELDEVAQQRTPERTAARRAKLAHHRRVRSRRRLPA